MMELTVKVKSEIILVQVNEVNLGDLQETLIELEDNIHTFLEQLRDYIKSDRKSSWEFEELMKDIKYFKDKYNNLKREQKAVELLQTGEQPEIKVHRMQNDFLLTIRNITIPLYQSCINRRLWKSPVEMFSISY